MASRVVGTGGDIEEVRLAVVMYGGVSLCVYMNGVADELLRLVRATAQDDNGYVVPETELRGSEHVYRKLGKQKYVIDILSGTSAGGINAVYLAKALVTEGSLDNLRKLWIEEGDVSKLIRDSRSVEGVEPLPPPGPQTTSLFNGDRMYRKLLEALDAMTGGATTRSRYVDALDLFVTTTDLNGLQQPLALSAGVPVKEAQHRHLFRFRYDPVEDVDHFTQEDHPFIAFAARCTSSFPAAFEPVTLGAISKIADDAPRPPRAADGKPASPYKSFNKNLEERWADAFFRQYGGKEQIKKLLARPFADGGYLDNKPFECAIERIEKRDADDRVTRKLVYVEPAPDATAKTRLEVPNFLENVGLALTLPGVEGIRNDLQRLVKRNFVIERLRRVWRDVQEDQRYAARPWPDKPGQVYAETFLDDLVKERGASYGAYHRLKVGSVTDDLARLIVRQLGWDEDSLDFVSVWQLVHEWRTRTFKAYSKAKIDVAGAPVEPPVSENAFLLSYDVGYRVRRLGFVIEQLSALIAGDRDSVPVDKATLPGDSDEVKAELLRIRSALRPVYRNLENLRHGFSKELEKEWEGLSKDATPLFDEIRKAGPRSSDRRGDLTADQVRPLAAIGLRVAEEFRKALVAASDEVERAIGPRPPNRPPPPKPQDPPKTFARFLYDEYERYDVVVFPVLQGSNMGQSRPVDVFRISPNDARRLYPHGAGKLGGSKLGHFGAFLDRQWRRNDAVWGRLDAAECLIRALYQDGTADPADTLVVNTLVDEAHERIVAEALPRDIAADAAAILLHDSAQLAELKRKSKDKALKADDPQLLDIVQRLGEEIQRKLVQQHGVQAQAITGSSATELLLSGAQSKSVLDYFRNGKVPDPGDPGALLETAGRSAVVLSGMIEGISRHDDDNDDDDGDDANGRAQPSLPRAKALTKVFKAASHLALLVVRVSLPGSVTRSLYERIVALFVIAASLLVIVGLFVSGPVFFAGAGVLAFILVVTIARVFVIDYIEHLAGAGVLATALATLIALFAVAIFALGAWRAVEYLDCGRHFVCAKTGHVLGGVCPEARNDRANPHD